MSNEKTNAILGTLLALDRGDAALGGLRLSEVCFWSNMKRMTTYRYLKKLVKLGLVCEVPKTYRKKTCVTYVIDNKGIQWIAKGF